MMMTMMMTMMTMMIINDTTVQYKYVQRTERVDYQLPRPVVMTWTLIIWRCCICVLILIDPFLFFF